MLTLPEKGGIVTLLNPGSETGGGNSKIPEPRQSDSSTSAGDAEASSANFEPEPIKKMNAVFMM